MGYKTRISPRGSDRGKDVEASPDGLGLTDPHIIVEVKHREGTTGSQELRSFIAALRPRHKGLRQHRRIHKGSKVRGRSS